MTYHHAFFRFSPIVAKTGRPTSRSDESTEFARTAVERLRLASREEPEAVLGVISRWLRQRNY